MAVLTGFGGRYESIRLQSGRNRPCVAVSHHFKELPDTRCLACNPTRSPWSNMTFHALQLGVRRILMRHEFRSHDVARLTAKLRCFHVLDRPIGQLRTYDHVENGRDGQEPRQAPQCRLSIKSAFTAYRRSTSSKINAEGNECQSSKEYHRQDQKNDNSDVRITGVTTKLQRQDKQPGKTCGRDQCRAHKAQPVSSQQLPNGSAGSCVHERRSGSVKITDPKPRAAPVRPDSYIH